MSALQLPVDLQTSQDALGQKQALLQALLQRSMTPQQGQMVSGHYVAPSALSQVFNLAGAFAGLKGMEGLNQEKQGLAQQYNTRLSEGLKQYLGNNVPGEILDDSQAGALLNDNVDPGHLADPHRDPRVAAVNAIGSGVPELKQLGLEDIKAALAGQRKLNEPEEFGTDPRLMMDPATQQLVNVLVGKRGTIRPVAGLAPATKMEATAGGQLFNPYGGAKGPYVGETFSDPVNINGEAVSFGDTSNRPVQAATRPPQNTITNNPVIHSQKAGMDAWSTRTAADVSDMAEAARGSVKLLGTLNQLEASGKAGVFSGPTANAATFISGLGQTLGIPVDAAKLGNSQTFDAASISAWQDMIKAAGGNRGVVKEEAQRIAQMVPQLSQSPQGREQLTAYLRQLATQTIQDARKASEEYGRALREQDPSLYTYGLGTAQMPRTEPLGVAPGAVSPAGGGTIHWNDIPGGR